MRNNTVLKRFMNAFWLRPENAIILAMRSERLKEMTIKAPAIDISCGDGIFTFIHFGGELNKEFDVFQSTGDLNKVRNTNLDIYDSYDSSYSPCIKTKANFQYDIGTDLKQSSLNRAKHLGHYKDLNLLNVCNRFPFPDKAFATVTSFGSINHYPSIDIFLSECYRILKPGGQLILNAYSPNMIDLYKHLEQKYPDEWIKLIERNMRNIWPTMHSSEEWLRILESYGFQINSQKAVCNDELAKIWNVGLRPLTSELVKLSKIAIKYQEKEFIKIKQSWVELMMQLSQPFMYNSENMDSATDYLFSAIKI